MASYTTYVPLTEQQLVEKNKLKRAYARFWDNSAFRKGWSQPPFPLSEAEHLLEEAAELVVRIRTALREGGKKCRGPAGHIQGSATEYFWSTSSKPQEVSKFVTGLVMATLQDEDGYLYDVDDAWVNERVSELRAMHALELSDIELREKQLQEHIGAALKEITSRLEALTVQPSLSASVSDSDGAGHVDRISLLKRHVAMLQHIADGCDRVKANLALLDTHRSIESSIVEEEEEEATAMQVEQPSESPPAPTADATVDAPAAGEQEASDTGADEAEPSKEGASGEPGGDVEDGDGAQESKATNAVLLEVKKVSEEVDHIDVEMRGLHEHLDAITAQGGASAGDASAAVDDLEKKCLGYANLLLRDLEKLDSIVGGAEVRPQRKAQVVRVQQLLDDVDSMKAKLHELHEQVKEAEAAKQAEAAPDDSAGETPDAAEAPASPAADATTDDDTAIEVAHVPKKRKLHDSAEAMWEDLVLPIHFDVNNEEKAYELVADAHGIKQDDISIKVGPNNQTVTITGVRLPTEKAIEQMHARLDEMLREYCPDECKKVSQEERDMLVCRMGTGRYGKFSKTFRVPPGIDIDSMEARLEGGVLAVTLPKTAELIQAEQREAERMRARTAMPFGYAPAGASNSDFVRRLPRDFFSRMSPY